MDYEKKYNEALERAKAYHRNELAGSRREMTEYIFPELRESEDEEIYREIYSIVHHYYERKADLLVSSRDRNEMHEKWEKAKSFLEKQKESHIPWYDYQKSKEAGYTIVPNEEYEQLIKQKEQKPDIELIQRSWYMEGYNDREFGMEPKWIIKTGEGGPKHELNPKYGQSIADEQKPTEEQLHNLNEAIKGLRMDGCERMADSLHSLYNILTKEQKPAEVDESTKRLNDNWMKQHFDDYKEQKPCGCVNVESEYDKGWRDGHKAGLKDAEMQKPAWSKEDEKMLDAMIDIVSGSFYEPLCPRKEMLAWLKRLRPSWRPSKEHIDALEKAIVRSCSHQYGVPLSELYEQLKKL